MNTAQINAIKMTAASSDPVAVALTDERIAAKRACTAARTPTTAPSDAMYRREEIAIADCIAFGLRLA